MTESPDLLDSSYYRPLFRLLSDMDRDIAQLYRERGEGSIATRFVGPLIALSRHGPMTVRELAASREVTHSAMSQTVSAMAADGFVVTSPGADARTRVVSLTHRAEALVPLLQAEWRATEAAVRELDGELAHPLLSVVEEILTALEGRPFRDRLRDHLSRTLDERS